MHIIKVVEAKPFEKRSASKGFFVYIKTGLWESGGFYFFMFLSK